MKKREVYVNRRLKRGKIDIDLGKKRKYFTWSPSQILTRLEMEPELALFSSANCSGSGSIRPDPDPETERGEGGLRLDTGL